MLVQAIIALVGLASALGDTGVERRSSSAPLQSRRARARPASCSPPRSRQAQRAGRDAPLRWRSSLGLVGALITGTTLMGQLERALNRIYGVEQDRPTLAEVRPRRSCSPSRPGLLAAVAFVALAFGTAIGDAFNNDAVATRVGGRALAARARR